MLRGAVVFLCALALCGGAALAQLQSDELAGRYQVECADAGHPEGWFLEQDAWFSANQVRFHKQWWGDEECQGGDELHYEADFAAFYDLGAEWTGVGLPEGTTELNMFYRQGQKQIRARSEEGQMFLEESCSTAFPVDVWVDVSGLDCAPWLFSCSESNFAEYSCVSRSGNSSATLCDVDPVLGPCVPATRLPQLQPFAQDFEGALEPPTEEDIEGTYWISCQVFAGLPENWRLQEVTTADGDVIRRVSWVYDNPYCEGKEAFKYVRHQQYINGPLFEDFVDQLLPTFEHNTRFVQEKEIRARTASGANFLNQLCDGAAVFPVDETVDISDVNCPPFFFSCGQELSCINQDPISGDLRFCARNPADGSCTPQTRLAQYFDVVLSLDSAAALSSSLLFVAALALLAAAL